VGRMQVKEFAPGVRQAADLGHATGDQGCCRRPKIDSLKGIVPIQN
jgi:hypothetical protein